MDIAYKWSHLICGSFVTGFFHLAMLFSRFTYTVACICLFLLLNNILLYGYITLWLSIHQLIDIWIVCIVWLSWTMVVCYLCTGFVWTYVFICLIYIPSSGIAGPNVNSVFNLFCVCVCLIFSGHTSVFSKVAASYYIRISS